MAQFEDLTLRISGMHCASCVSSIEKGLATLEGVKETTVNLALNSANVVFNRAKVNEAEVIERIRELGYQAEVGTPDILTQNARELMGARRSFVLAAVLALPVMVVAMLPMFAGHRQLIDPLISGLAQFFFTTIVVFFAGREILKDALLQTRHLRANMNSLIALGTITAYGWSLFALSRVYTTGRHEDLYFESASVIIALILLGRWLEARSKGKAGEAIRALMQLTPSKAMAVINGVEIEIDASSVQPGMLLIVRPGERLPADGEVTEGSPSIDEALLTGESLPVDKREGDSVIGGSLNGTIPFRMKVTASGEASFLSSIVRLVAEAQSQRAPIQKLADRVAGVFVPIVMLIALATLAGWYFIAPGSEMMIKSVVSVLIIACPCALGLATPTAVLAGTGRAARDGIIIRGGDVLEKLSQIDTVVFDKTGTLTHGKLEVVEVFTFGELSRRHLIRMVGSLEVNSEHPVAKAIVNYMKKEEIESSAARNVAVLPGYGLKAEYDGRAVVVGNQALMQQEKVGFGQALMASEKEMDKGRTIVFVAVDHQVVGMLALGDRVRGEARETIMHLKKMVGKVMMLSGDNRKTAGGVAHALGIDSFEAEIKPHQKQQIIEVLRKAGHKVAMVGDGINDAPALAKADVGVAIGGGTDIAIEAAQVVLVRGELHRLVHMMKIARVSMRIIRENLFWAFAYNVAAIPVAAGLFYPLNGWTLSPMIAAAAMSFSSVFVVTNSLRLNRIDLR